MRPYKAITPSLIGILLASPSVAPAQSKATPRELGDVCRGILAVPLKDAESALERRLQAERGNDEVRFGLGAVRLLRAVERLGQAFYRHGYCADRTLGILTFVGAPQPPSLGGCTNPDPSPIDYEKVRAILQLLLGDLQRVEETLAPIRDAGVKLPIPIGLVRMDLNGDGVLQDDESLWRQYARMAGAPGGSESAAREFVIVFDRADVEWLRGYGRLLQALIEAALAYDMKELFDRTGHLLFAGYESPYAFLRRTGDQKQLGYDYGSITDLIAFIHLLNFRVREPARMKAAHEHLLAVIEHSRAMWRLVLAETDDDCEWIPSPRQTSVLANIRFSQEMVDGWQEVLKEIDGLLRGTKLVPFWRNDARGVNLKRVFLEPADFDAVMWMQGTGAATFLEHGDKTTVETWQRFEQIFGGRFFAFAAWVN
jgi:hypothetical protein